MSEAPKPGGAQPAKPATKRERDIPWGLIGIVILVVYVVVFAALNSDEVKVDFVFFSTRTSLVVVILLGIVIGFAGGYIVSELRARRRRKRIAQATRPTTSRP